MQAGATAGRGEFVPRADQNPASLAAPVTKAARHPHRNRWLPAGPGFCLAHPEQPDGQRG